MKVFLANFILELIWQHFCLVIRGLETKLNTQIWEFEIWSFKGILYRNSNLE
jgi:hypothetical protein